MARGTGEMPFLDHLEELRKRILWSLLAVVLCFAIGLWLVSRFDLIGVLKSPIAPLLPNGQLMVTSPTEPLMITLKLGFITGLVLASPVILWQLWAFLSPALYEREKKTLVPALFVGLLLFLSGAVLSFVFVVPQALRVLLGFQQGAFATMITFENYFSFVMQLILALGLSFELPLLMVILAALGILRVPMLNKIRPYAVVGSFVLGAVLSPGADVLSMFMLTIPLLLLYEVGVVGVLVVQRRRDRAANISTLEKLATGDGARYEADMRDLGTNAPFLFALLGGKLWSWSMAKTILGEAQWSWLAEQLRVSADVRIIASGIQIVAEGHGWERWGNLPLERRRFFDLVRETRAGGVVILSGDRHVGALYRETDGPPYPLHEITSSGINMVFERAREAGPNRLGDLVTEANFGALDTDWAGGRVVLAVRGGDGAARRETSVPFTAMAAPR